MTKLTEKTIYEIIGKQAEKIEGIKVETLREFCDKKVAALEAKAAKAKERAAEKAVKGDELEAIVAEALTSELQSIADITTKVQAINAEATTSKVTYRLSKLVEKEIAVKETVTIKGGTGEKARKIQNYRLA